MPSVHADAGRACAIHFSNDPYVSAHFKLALTGPGSRSATT